MAGDGRFLSEEMLYEADCPGYFGLRIIGKHPETFLATKRVHEAALSEKPRQICLRHSVGPFKATFVLKPQERSQS